MTSIYQPRRQHITRNVRVIVSEERRCKTKSKSMAKELPGVRALICSSSVAVQQPTGYFSSHSFSKILKLMHGLHEKLPIKAQFSSWAT